MESINLVGTLSDKQTARFDFESIVPRRWEMVQACLQADFPEGDFRFLDLGGGNGLFADKLLEAYPRATGVLLDNSAPMLAKNTEHPRKELILDSVSNVAAHFEAGAFDVIFLNWVLHHLVGGSYGATVKNIQGALEICRSLLSPRGRLAVFENSYDGLVVDNLPSHLLFALTTSRALARVMRPLGANSAGCGICPQSRRGWERLLHAAGLTVARLAVDGEKDTSRVKLFLLHCGSARVELFWLAAA